jgi:hypothetical protein
VRFGFIFSTIGQRIIALAPTPKVNFETYIKYLAPSTWTGNLIEVFKLIGLKQKVITLSVEEKINYYKQYRLADQLSYFKKKKKYFTNRIRIYKTITLLFLSVNITWGVFKMLAEFYPSLSFFMDM